jgi:hypothetical protein
VFYPQPNPAPQVFTQAPQQRQGQTRRRNNTPVPQYPPLPVSQAEIYKQLTEEGLLSPLPTRPWGPPFPEWYNPDVKCAYHSNVSGHSTENCAKLRQKIYEMINAGSITLNSVEQEPLNTNDPPKIDNIAPEESTNFIGEGKDDQEIEKPGDHKKYMHITATGDDSIAPYIWKISQEEGPQNYIVTPLIFPEM